MICTAHQILFGDQVEKNEKGGACSTYRGRGELYNRALVGKPEGKRPLGSHRRRWKDNIKMDLQEVDVEVWTGLIWLRTGIGGEHL